jgi:CheY-like chemotaxis protein
MIQSGKYILLAEDDAHVAELVIHALTNHDPAPKIIHVRDGVDALDFLYARGQFQHRDMANPAVVLLDVKMPRMDGLEVLRQIKADERLRITPVVILTSSHDDRDVREAYLLGANAFVVKPLDFRRFATVLRQIEGFWLGVNHPPPDSRADAMAAAAKSGDELASHDDDPAAKS